MNFELCTDGLEGAKLGAKFKLKRIELCSALTVGGLTPSLGLVKRCVEFGKIEIHVMIRPREGCFFYSEEEFEIMKLDVENAIKMKVSGIVFGMLNKENEIDWRNQELVDLAKSNGLEVTFHRAFDLVSDPDRSIQTLINFGFDRVLTSGGKENVDLGFDQIQFLHGKYGNQIQIMPGGGVNHENVKLLASVGIENFHFTSRRPVKQKIQPGMGMEMLSDGKKVRAILNQFK